MGIPNMADISEPGVDNLEAPETGNENPEVSPTKTNEPETTPSSEGDENTQNDLEDPNTPFHEHPRWQERENEWKDRFNDQEQRHQQEMKEMRESIEALSKTTEQPKSQVTEKIPSWFGGTKEQWETYQADLNARMEQVKEEAYQRVTSEQEKQSNAVKEATEFAKSEVQAIQKDKQLNPDGLTVDPNKLVRFTVDNDLVDSQGRWNYRAGWKILLASGSVSKKNTTAQRKEIVKDITNPRDKGETRQKPFKTSEDFKKGGTPW